MTSPTFLRRAARTAVAVAALLAVPAGAAAAQAVDPKWLTVNASARMAILALTGSATPVNAGYNLNGFSDGKLTLTVPTGWKMVFYFHNRHERFSHHVGVSAGTAVPEAAFPAAFKGAETGSPGFMVIPNGRIPVRFTAERAGEYLIACTFPGHAKGGMYVKLVVADGATAPTLTAN